MGWTVTDDVEVFRRATADHLRAHRVACTVVLTIVERLRMPGAAAEDGPPELAWWDGDGGAVIARTPPHRPVVSAMSPAAAAAWAAAQPCPERVLGPADTVEHLARAWGATTEPVVTERLHRLERLRPPVDPPPTRRAVAGDADLLWSWLLEFHHEATPDDPVPPRAAMDAAVAEGRAVVALAGGEPVAYASASPVMLGTVRIGPVYTRPAHRGNGHGAAVAAAAARHARERGADEVLLFTDLDNPTSNALYARLGFVGVTDIVDARLVPAST
ncbi:GNAT family N-acetyltransferase [Actinomycetospora flava]|uniref:GNAT family N-acetyltransferase n=1 Tax=Actinomycetospora flava TaxID=3129232 RepID=A0ABU8M299_9PSEU